MPRKKVKKPLPRKSSSLHRFLLLLFSLVFFAGLMAYIVFLRMPAEKKILEKPLSSATPAGTVEEKQVYTNKQLGFTLEYPKGWTYRNFDGGVAFRRKDKPNDPAHEFIVVRILPKVGDNTHTSLEAYAKIAGPLEIQNYKSLKGFRKITTSTDIVGYEAYWNFVTLDGKADISDPITYFALQNDSTKIIEIALANGKYYDIFEAMTASFGYTK